MLSALRGVRTRSVLHDLADQAGGQPDIETGSVVVMSSGLGSIADNETGGWEVYRASKAALNTLMRSYTARHSRYNC